MSKRELELSNGFQIEQSERPVAEPFSLVFHGKPPKSFGGLHQEITERLPSLPQLSSLVSRVKAYQRYTALLDELDVARQSPRIVEGENGMIMLFHISPDPDQLIQTLYSNDLQTRPEGEVSWGRRCFGARLACFTDPSVIKEQLKRRKLNSQNVIGIESDGMRDQHEVVVEDGYRAYLTDWVLDFVNRDSNLRK